MTETSITKVGDSYYALIPKYLVDSLPIENGKKAEIDFNGEKITITITKGSSNAIR